MTHLSDEALAAFADNVLTGLARERALRHTKVCAECRHAVAVQREAVWALRAAPAPALPGGLLDRLRGLPETTPITTPVPSAVAPDGRAMLSALAPVAALVPAAPVARPHRLRPVLGTAAALAVAGAVVAGSASGIATSSHQPAPAAPGSASLVGFHAPGR
jgi:hypothetical protein